MEIQLSKLSYSFVNKPVLVGGGAMEYYGLRKSGGDIDLIASESDIRGLLKMYPNKIRDLWGDLGVCPFEFEIWKSIHYFDYDFYKEGAIDKGDYLVVSIEKLLFMKTLVIEKEKYLNDVKLIVQYLSTKQNDLSAEIVFKNKQIISEIEGIDYLEKVGGKQIV